MDHSCARFPANIYRGNKPFNFINDEVRGSYMRLHRGWNVNAPLRYLFWGLSGWSLSSASPPSCLHKPARSSLLARMTAMPISLNQRWYTWCRICCSTSRRFWRGAWRSSRWTFGARGPPLVRMGKEQIAPLLIPFCMRWRCGSQCIIHHLSPRIYAVANILVHAIQWRPHLTASGRKAGSLINVLYTMPLNNVDALWCVVGGSGPWLEVETADSMEMLDWITAQPWSNGKVHTHICISRGIHTIYVYV